MKDLISRQAAIDEIDEWIKAFRENVHKESAADARFIRDGIIQLPSAQPEQRWIPVSKRLPDDLQEVIVTWINREYAPIKDIPQTGCAVYYGGCWYWSSPTCIEILEEHGKNYVDQIYDGIEISAWQPLPEPYKEDKE